MKTIGSYLLEMGAVSEESILSAVEIQKKNGDLIGSILCRLGHISQSSLELAYALQQRDQNARQGLLSALRYSLRLFQKSRVGLGRIFLCVATGCLSGVFSFPIIFYFYSGWAWEMIGVSTNMAYIFQISLGAICLVLLSVGLEAFASYLSIDITSSLLQSSTSAMHRNVVYRAVHRNTGESNDLVMSIYAQNIEQYAIQTESFLNTFPKTLSGLVCFFLVIAFGNPGVAAITIVLGSIAIIFPPLLASRAQPFLHKEAGLMGAAMSNIEPFFMNFRTVGGVLLKTATERIAHYLKPHHLNQASKWFYWTTSFNLRSLLNFVTLSGILIYGGFAVLNDKMPLAGLFSLYLGVTLMLPRFNSLYDSYFQAVTAGYHARIIDEQLSVAEVEPISAVAPIEPFDLCVDIGCFGFGDRIVLNGFSSVFSAGKLYIVVGESGCGKSTLAKVIAGLLKCETAVIEVVTRNGEKTACALGSVAYIGPEHVFLENFSVEQNVCREVDSHVEKKLLVEKLIGNFNIDATGRLSDHEFSMNNGFSGGEKQRFHIIQGLLAEQKIKIFDEPTASLDVETAGVIKRAIANVPGDEVRIVITHDPSWDVSDDQVIRLYAVGK